MNDLGLECPFEGELHHEAAAYDTDVPYGLSNRGCGDDCGGYGNGWGNSFRSGDSGPTDYHGWPVGVVSCGVGLIGAVVAVRVKQT